MGMRMGMGMGGGDSEGAAPAADGVVATPKPMHPRFTAKEGEGGMNAGRMGMSMPPMGGSPGEGAPVAAEAPAITDESFLAWIYVDADGKPLKGEEVATSPSALMTHLMPFVIRATIDQRKLDAFLVQLATASVPIDIRQVRINPPADTTGAMGAGQMGMMGRPPGAFGSGSPNRGMPMGRPPMGGFGDDGQASGAAAPTGGMVRPHDVVLEVRGTIALATQPDPAALGLESETADAAPDGNEPEPTADSAAPVVPVDAAQAAGDGPAPLAAQPAAAGEDDPPAADAEPAAAEPAPAADEAPAGDAPPAAAPAEPA